MEKKVLSDKEIYPDKKVLENALGKSFATYEELLSIITSENFNLVPEWRYYNDGKSWLCKVVFKKKTIFWLSVWDGYFKISFYFTEKNGSGISELNIKSNIKKQFLDSKSVGKLKPIVLEIKAKEHINDLLELTKYKKNIK